MHYHVCNVNVFTDCKIMKSFTVQQLGEDIFRKGCLYRNVYKELYINWNLKWYGFSIFHINEFFLSY